MLKEKKIKTFTIVVTLLLPMVILAADSYKIISPVGLKGGLIGFLKTIVASITYLAVPIIVLAFVYSGFYFVFASGNDKSLKKAKDILLMVVIGSIIILGSNLMLSLVQDTAEKVTDNTVLEVK